MDFDQIAAKLEESHGLSDVANRKRKLRTNPRTAKKKVKLGEV